ncbi:CLUMA_CG012536, isoform A [Clunio marinus]|uniref:CLUMA_CG012536, isoform A n=1 Tax=Clunio marinus TaxID=568069 RepID=A0A1J1IG22_9DIPT|nr:CLUMA_CG012536, isoform A [Clunio marinus]
MSKAKLQRIISHEKLSSFQQALLLSCSIQISIEFKLFSLLVSITFCESSNIHHSKIRSKRKVFLCKIGNVDVRDYQQRRRRPFKVISFTVNCIRHKSSTLNNENFLSATNCNGTQIL